MAGREVMLCIYILIVDIIAGILGIKAEFTQNKSANMRVSTLFECKELARHAYKFSVAAVVLLSVGNSLARCFQLCTLRTSGQYTKSSMNKLLEVLEWMVYWVTFSLLVCGAVASAKARSSCSFARHHFMLIGGILCFVHAIVSVAYYANSAASARKGAPTVQSQTDGTSKAPPQDV